MEIIVFILLAGVWAAFLLPSFFEHRRQTPRAATRDFARSKELLASVSTATPDGGAYARRHAQARRRRFLIGMFVAAVTTLVIAVITGSVYWLAASLVIDVAIGAVVGVLIHVQNTGARGFSVIPFTQPTTQVDTPTLGTVEDIPSVRVIAG